MLLVALISVAAAVEAVPAPPAPAPVVVTGELPDDQKRVCKPAEEEIGSIIPKKVCRTKGEWAAMKRANERRTRAYMDDKNTMSGRAPARQESNQ